MGTAWVVKNIFERFDLKSEVNKNSRSQQREVPMYDGEIRGIPRHGWRYLRCINDVFDVVVTSLKRQCSGSLKLPVKEFWVKHWSFGWKRFHFVKLSTWCESRWVFYPKNIFYSAGSMMIWFLMVSILLPAVLGNSEGEKWTWPSSQKDLEQADSRKDIYYESSNEKAGRIRVPTSYYDNRRLSVQEFSKCESFSFRLRSTLEYSKQALLSLSLLKVFSYANGTSRR